MPARLDPESLAVEAMLRLEEEIRARASGECQPLATRASDLPQLLAQTGLLAASLFYISKSNEELYKELTRKLGPSGAGGNAAGGQQGGGKDPLPEECRGEGRGYTLGLALLAHALAAMGEAGLLGDASGQCRRGSIGDFKGLARCLLEIRRSGVDIKAERILAPYLTTVKRLAEALYKRRGEGGP